MAKLIVEVPDEVKQALKLRAVKEKTSIKAIVNQLIIDFLTHDSSGQIKLFKNSLE
ncbi:MAG: hypothetical protein HQK56_01780 [Deltaproteobacteria bacterium]|nr:hypothetical protein [Deltaproteobacteria bacterium]